MFTVPSSPRRRGPGDFPGPIAVKSPGSRLRGSGDVEADPQMLDPKALQSGDRG